MRRFRLPLAAPFLLAALSGCGPTHSVDAATSIDAGFDAAGPRDAGPNAQPDGGLDAAIGPHDAGPSFIDAGADGGDLDGGDLAALCPREDCYRDILGDTICDANGDLLVCTEAAPGCFVYARHSCGGGQRCSYTGNPALGSNYGCASTCRSSRCANAIGHGPPPYEYCDGDLLMRCADNNSDGCVDNYLVEACDRTNTGRFCFDDGDGPSCLACLDECTGPDYCSGNLTIQRCMDIDGDGCLESVREQCTPYVEACDPATVTCECIDECLAGQRRCGDYFTEQTCMDHDGDGCTEWGGDVTCAAGSSCWTSQAMCLPGCRNECAAGTGQCFGGGTRSRWCADHDGDGCTEYNPITPCPASTPICEIGRGCVECVGGVDCGSGLLECEANRCQPPPGRCFDAVGVPATVSPPSPGGPDPTVRLTVNVPSSIPIGRVHVFLGISSLSSFREAMEGRLVGPSGTDATIWSFTVTPNDAYIDSFWASYDQRIAPELARFNGQNALGTWTIVLSTFSVGFRADVDRAAVCFE